jgi:dTDP-4-amino-4,6-dideoxygalactose transaminase
MKSLVALKYSGLCARKTSDNVHYIPVSPASALSRPVGLQRRRIPGGGARAFEELISLPMFHGMTDQDVEEVIGAVSKVMHDCAR